jgi:hypothetical protein
MTARSLLIASPEFSAEIAEIIVAIQDDLDDPSTAMAVRY